MRHGLPCSYHKGQLGRVHVVIVLTSATIAKYETEITRYNQTCGDLMLVERADRCYDMQSALSVLDGVPTTGEPSALAADSSALAAVANALAADASVLEAVASLHEPDKATAAAEPVADRMGAGNT